MFCWSFTQPANVDAVVFVTFFSSRICFDTNQHSLNICWMNGKKKSLYLINEWVDVCCVHSTCAKLERVVSLSLSFLPDTLHHVFFAVAFQPLPHLLKSDETYLLNCVCHCEIDFSSLFFFFILSFSFLRLQLRMSLSWLCLAWLCLALGKMSFQLTEQIHILTSERKNILSIRYDKNKKQQHHQQQQQQQFSFESFKCVYVKMVCGVWMWMLVLFRSQAVMT